MADNKYLTIYPSPIENLGYPGMHVIYQELIRHAVVRRHSASLLASLAKVTTKKPDLILEKPLSNIDLYLIWGSSQAPKIKGIVYNPTDFAFSEKKWIREIETFESLYGAPCPLDFLKLLHFDRIVTTVFSEAVAADLYNELGFFYLNSSTAGVQVNLDPAHAGEPNALARGKYGHQEPDYFPFASYGYDYGTYGLYIDYRKRKVVAASHGDGLFTFARNPWDDFLTLLNLELPFEWTKPKKFYRREHDEGMGAPVGEDPDKAAIRALKNYAGQLIGKISGKNRKIDPECDNDEVFREYIQDRWIHIFTWQRMVTAYVNKNQINMYSVSRSMFREYFRDGVRQRDTFIRKGVYVEDDRSGVDMPRRYLPMSYSRFSEAEKIDAVVAYGKSIIGLLNLLDETKSDKVKYYSMYMRKFTDSRKLLVSFKDVASVVITKELRKATLTEASFSGKRNEIVTKKLLESALDRLVKYVHSEALDGYPMLAYLLAFHFWSDFKPSTTQISLELFRATLPELGMDPLMKSIEVHAKIRFDKYIYT